MTELVLGTAQFGTSYGITNASGRLDDRTISGILDIAAQGGVDLFDTAPDYGDAQERLGRLVSAPHPRYVSKFSLPPSGEPTAERLLGETVSTLGVASLHALLFHKPADLRDPRASTAWQILREARDSGAVARIGASIYDAEDLAVVVRDLPGLDILQLPGNVVDRRLLDDPVVRGLHEDGVEIHVRSAYLQGLLLVEPDAVPGNLAELRPVVARLRSAAARLGVPVAAAALGYLRDHPIADAVLVGATSPAELSETLAAWAADIGGDELVPDPGLPSDVIDPRSWPAREAR